MKLPNFLIVGFPKCGTTSIVNALRNHKDVFIPKEKELRFFTSEYLVGNNYKGPGDFLTEKIVVKDWEEYQKLFKKIKSENAVGEATTDTAYYHNLTIPEIKDKTDDPKIIIFLRHPVNRAISAYSHLVRDEREKLSFEKALMAENSRLKSGYESIWAYSEGSKYFDAVKAFKDNFSQVKVIFFEEMKENFQETLNEIQNFLNIEIQNNLNTFHSNISGRPKNKVLNKFLNRPLLIKEYAKMIVGENRALKFKERIQRNNIDKIIVSEDIKSKLLKKHIKDIESLEKLLDKDLTFWKTV